MKTCKQTVTRDIEIKNNLTINTGEVGGDNGWQRGKVFQEQLLRTHGQNQGGFRSRGWRSDWVVGEL